MTVPLFTPELARAKIEKSASQVPMPPCWRKTCLINLAFPGF
jgi:hypothetical protein